MKILTYRIKLLEPVLVTSLDGDPNSAITFDYLPGGVLRGAIIGKHLRNQSLTPEQFNAEDAAAQRLFFDGTTRYLNGYLVESNQRTLPVPQSWQRKKTEESEVFDFAVEPPDDGDEPWQGVSKPFYRLVEPDEDDEDSKVKSRLVQPDHLITVHTERDRKQGRACVGSGAVYRYESLQAGQTFEAAIICEHDADGETLLPLIAGEAKIGGSRSGGYGRVQFAEVRQRESWREVGRTLEPDFDGKLILTLLSDALMRDANGQYVVDSEAVTTAFSAVLGNLPLPEPNRTFLRGSPIGGFNRKWGLPLPQTLAVKMGSVFVYDAPKRDATTLRIALETLEKRGIGERRAEGFGRVAVNWQTERHLKEDETLHSPPAPKAITEATSLTIAQRMAARMLRRKLDAALIDKANDLGRRIIGPRNSQLSRLRLIIHDCLRQGPTAGRRRLDQYFQSLLDRQTTRNQFIRDRIAGKGLMEWLQGRVTDETNIWSEIGINPDTLPTIGANVRATLSSELAYEYNLRLIDGVLARAAKERKREN